MQLLAIAPATLAIWVGILSAWAIWRQLSPVLEFGVRAVSHATSTFVAAVILLGLSVSFLHAFHKENGRAIPLFGVLAVMVATPPIFAGARANLPFFGYSYYGGFDWIASAWVQLSWLALVVLSILCLTHRAIVQEHASTASSGPFRTPRQVWMTTLYWVVTAWFTVLALNATSPFWSRTWLDLFRNIAGDAPFPPFSGSGVLVVAITLALWLRSGASFWLVAVWTVAYHLSSILTLQRYYPANRAYHPGTEYWLNHPVLILAILVAVALIQRAKVIRAL
jgi:hypothetical protein